MDLLLEERRYPPPEDFAAQANAQTAIYDRSRDEFWAAEARERVRWFEPFETVCEWNLPYAKWFVGGKLNATYNCVDRHVEAGHGEQVAFHWEGEPGDTRTITYAELQREVCKAANALTELGVQAGDRVAIQLPMIPEADMVALSTSVSNHWSRKSTALIVMSCTWLYLS